MFSICIGTIIFVIIDSVFAMLPVAPTYSAVLIIQVCILQHYLLDVIQEQVAYSFVNFGIHQIGAQEWEKRSFIWFEYVAFFTIEIRLRRESYLYERIFSICEIVQDEDSLVKF